MKTGFPPYLLEVLWNRLLALAEEQAQVLMRTAFSTIVREAGDLSAAVFDRRGRMVAQARTGTPGHVNTMARGMRFFLEEFPIGSIEPGDVLLSNDPYKLAGQLNDMCLVTPVFRNTRCVGFFASCCHMVDVGGVGLTADARNVFEEGLHVLRELWTNGSVTFPIDPFNKTCLLDGVDELGYIMGFEKEIAAYEANYQ